MPRILVPYNTVHKVTKSQSDLREEPDIFISIHGPDPG